MILSMTGFGDAQGTLDGVAITLELRSVNNKFFKLSARLPDALSAMESDIEAVLRKRIARGSVALTVRTHAEKTDAAQRIDTKVLAALVAQLEAVKPAGAIIDMASLLRVPGVMAAQEIDDNFLEKARPLVMDLLAKAADKFMAMRAHEGRALAEDLESNLAAMLDARAKILERAPATIKEYHTKLIARVQDLLASAELKVNEEALLREVAVYADRCDISEELSRLAAHVAQFREIMAAKGEIKDGGAGRKLDFLAQEMLREANTIGSKGADAAIARGVVELKTRIDRVKEQVQNVE
jgi:uncharacterized protein (TIGR00255 family)